MSNTKKVTILLYTQYVLNGRHDFQCYISHA